MKLAKKTSVLLMILATAIASESALAQRHGGFGGPRVTFGFNFGLPLYAPYYAPAPYYYPPYGYTPAPYYYPPVIQQAPQTYIEQGNYPASPPQGSPTDQASPPQTSPGKAQGSWWYYCGESRTFYPYVRECPGGWERVSPQPAPG